MEHILSQLKYGSQFQNNQCELPVKYGAQCDNSRAFVSRVEPGCQMVRQGLYLPAMNMQPYLSVEQRVVDRRLQVSRQPLQPRAELVALRLSPSQMQVDARAHADERSKQPEAVLESILREEVVAK